MAAGAGAPSRRTLLSAALIAGFGAVSTLAPSGCTSQPGPTPQPPPPASPDPDRGLRDRVAAEKRVLVALYAATLQLHPTLRGRLGPLRVDHDRHLGALGVPTASPSPAAAASEGATAPRVPADPVVAVRSLERTEQAAANRRVGQCVQAVDRQLARLLASMGACEAAHAALLRGTSG